MSLPPGLKIPHGWALNVDAGDSCPHCAKPLREPQYTLVRKVDNRRWPIICQRAQLASTVKAVIDAHSGVAA